MTKPDLYEQDFALWGAEQSQALRLGDLERLDAVHLVEELEILIRSQRRRLADGIERWVMLSIDATPTGDAPALWRRSVDAARTEVAAVLTESPSLAAEIPTCLARCYPGIRSLAVAARGGAAAAALPEACPYTLEALLAEITLS